MNLSNLGVQLTAAATALLLPFVWRQGQRVRATLPQLPAAGGPRTGEVRGTGLPVRLLVFGESTAAGVGASNHAEGLAGQTARILARQTGRPVHWRAHGQRGLTARAAHDALLPTLPRAPFHVVILALGVNDVIALHSPLRWQRDLGRLVANLRARIDHPPVVLAGVPPINRFPALPQPLRTVLGWRGRLLDRAARIFAQSTRAVTHTATSLPEGDAGFCSDGFHPAPAGYAQWGARLARTATQTMQQRR